MSLPTPVGTVLTASSFLVEDCGLEEPKLTMTTPIRSSVEMCG
jgi:hypothetical protein